MISCTKSQAEFLKRFGADKKSDRHQLALLSVAEAYESSAWSKDGTRWMLRKAAAPIYKRRLKEKYGSVIVILLLVAGALALETAFEWAVTRILDWLWPESDKPSPERRKELLALQEAWRADR